MPLPRLAAVALAVALGVSAPTASAGAAAAPDDPGLSRQWGLERIHAVEAWSVATGTGVTIAIIDSGVDAGHDDLVDKDVQLVDCVGREVCVEGAGADDAGHGTHVAGIAAATTDNGRGVAGVAPDAGLLSVRALANACDGNGENCQARGTESDVVRAIDYAVAHGARVINLSLGSLTQPLLGPGDAFRRALDDAWSAGAIPVLVAGNENLLPGSLIDVPAVIVSATNRADGVASYSSGVGNVRWAVAAPGGEADTPSSGGVPGSCESATPNGILSTYFDPRAASHNTYACVAGTSMAAPHVAGALAILLSAGIGPSEAVDRLLTTADDLGAPGWDATYGSGRINLARAVAGLSAASAGDGAVTGEPEGTATTGAVAATGDPTGGSLTTVPGATSTSTTSPVVAPGVTTPPVAFDNAAGSVDVSGRPEGSLPAGPLTLAVAFVVGAAGAHAWRYLASASWARRTPDR